MITNKQFIKISQGEVFAEGVLFNQHDSLYMTDQYKGRMIRWCARKGYGDDWAIYCGWYYRSFDWILQHGDKVTADYHIKRCVPCDNEVMEKYRY